jgi:hypothetical protein
MGKPLADEKLLAGKKFIATSGNRCVFISLGRGGLQGSWKTKPTAADTAEAEGFISHTLNANITTYDAGKRSDGAIAKSKAAYEEWAKRR